MLSPQIDNLSAWRYIIVLLHIFYDFSFHKIFLAANDVESLLLGHLHSLSSQVVDGLQFHRFLSRSHILNAHHAVVLTIERYSHTGLQRSGRLQIGSERIDVCTASSSYLNEGITLKAVVGRAILHRLKSLTLVDTNEADVALRHRLQ